MRLKFSKKILLTALAITLAGCQSNLTKEDYGTAIGGAIGGILGNKVADDNKALWTAAAALAGGYLGKQIGRYLDEQDRQRMAHVTAQTVSTGKAHSWVNPDNKTSGKARVVATETKAEPVKVRVLKKKVKKVPPLDIVGQTYRATKTSNVRGGPSTDYEIVGKLTADERANVVGQVKDQPWYLISQDGIGSGFVWKPLMEPAPLEAPDSSGLAIASSDISEQEIAPTRVCRTVEQSVSLADGSSQSETIQACQGPNGWEVVQA